MNSLRAVMERLPETEAGPRREGLAWAERHGDDLKAAIHDAENVHCLLAFLVLTGLDDRRAVDVTLSIVDDAWEPRPTHLEELCKGILMSAELAAEGPELDRELSILEIIDTAADDAFRAAQYITETMEAQAGSPPTTTTELREFLLGLSRLSASAAFVESLGYLAKMCVITVGARAAGRAEEATPIRAAAASHCVRGITRAHALAEAGVATEPDAKPFLGRGCARTHRLLLQLVPEQTVIDFAL